MSFEFDFFVKLFCIYCIDFFYTHISEISHVFYRSTCSSTTCFILNVVQCLFSVFKNIIENIPDLMLLFQMNHSNIQIQYSNIFLLFSFFSFFEQIKIPNAFISNYVKSIINSNISRCVSTKCFIMFLIIIHDYIPYYISIQFNSMKIPMCIAVYIFHLFHFILYTFIYVFT